MRNVKFCEIPREKEEIPRENAAQIHGKKPQILRFGLKIPRAPGNFGP